MRSLTAVRSTVTECLIGSGLISKTVDSIFQLDPSKYLQVTFLFALMPFFQLSCPVKCSKVPFGYYLVTFSSPELKAQVSFSDQNLSSVPRRCCCRKLSTFSSSSPEPLGQNNQTWVKASLGEGDSRPRPFSRGDN